MKIKLRNHYLKQTGCLAKHTNGSFAKAYVLWLEKRVTLLESNNKKLQTDACQKFWVRCQSYPMYRCKQDCPDRQHTAEL